MPPSKSAKKALNSYISQVKKLGKKYGQNISTAAKKKKTTKTTGKKKYVTRNQVKRMINAEHDMEYYKTPIGGAFQTYTIGSNTQMKMVNLDPAFKLSSKWQTYRFELPPKTGAFINGVNAFGNSRTDIISLKKIAFYATLLASVQEIYVKYIIVETTLDSENDYQALLEKQLISVHPLSFVTVGQQRIIQNQEEVARKYKVIHSRTIKLPVLYTITTAGEMPTGNQEARKIQWSKTFGQNGKKVRFNGAAATDGDSKIYYLSIASVKANGDLMSANQVGIFGVQTCYFNNIQDENS